MTEFRRVNAVVLREMPLPQPQQRVDKNSRGTALVAGGSATSPGAVMLSGVAAFRAGAGKVLLAVPQPLALAIATALPEAGVHGFAGTLEGDPDAQAASQQIGELLSLADAVLIGPGFTNEAVARDVAHRLLADATCQPLVIDALSLTGLWNHQKVLARRNGNVVITPHAGEMARLMGVSTEEIVADPRRFARDAAVHLQCVVILKGSCTVIAQPSGPVYFHDLDIPGLATSGSGDVLAGILVGLLARGATPVAAAVWSVHLHAQAGLKLAGRMGPVGLLARELAAEIPALMEAGSEIPTTDFA